MTNRKYDNIKVLRIIACMGVVLTHISRGWDMPDIIRKVCGFGSCGVYMFFLISGFVGFRYLDSKNDVLNYWKRRFIKIVPVYYVVMLSYFVLYEIIPCNKNMPIDEMGVGWWRYVTFINYCIPGDVLWRNIGGVWTISFFLLFYLLVPVLQRSIRTYRMSLCITGVFLIVKMLWLDQWIEWFSPLWGIFYFMVGVTANVAMKEKKGFQYIALLSVFSIGLIAVEHYDPILYVSIFGILLLTTLEWRIPLKYRAIVDLLDEYTYVIYLGHILALEIISAFGYSKVGVEFVALFIVVTFFVCLILHNLIELPILKIQRLKTKYE